MLPRYYILLIGFATATASCKKDWIDERSNKALVIPSTVKDFQALMDNTPIMNDVQPYFGDMSSDDYYVLPTYWQTWTSLYRNAYVWEPDVYNGVGGDNGNWNNSYRVVFYSNIVMDGIDKVPAAELNTAPWQNAKGSALFHRAHMFAHLVHIFAKPYDAATAGTDLGIPIRLTSDPNLPSVRASVKDSYERIIQDLLEAKDLLPVTATVKYRPSKPAAFAALARIYLSMRDYPNAHKYADSCLKLVNTLVDYNTLSATPQYTIPLTFAEVIYHSAQSEALPLNNYFVDSTLYQSYATNDLRKTLYFKSAGSGKYTFWGSYSGSTGSIAARPFNGYATDEMYLVRAEANARAGNVTAVMDDLNTLLRKRWKTGTYVNMTATSGADALGKILVERRKQLLFRSLRWMDLRRLNKEGANITLTRIVNNQTYTLAPNSSKYVMPIPPDVISLSGMVQNER